MFPAGALHPLLSTGEATSEMLFSAGPFSARHTGAKGSFQPQPFCCPMTGWERCGSSAYRRESSRGWDLNRVYEGRVQSRQSKAHFSGAQPQGKKQQAQSATQKTLLRCVSDRLPAQVAQRDCGTLSLEIFKSHPDMVLGYWVQVSLLEQEGWIRWLQRSLWTLTAQWFCVWIKLSHDTGTELNTAPGYSSLGVLVHVT